MYQNYRQTMQDQNDLDSLCKDRPLLTNEIFPPNDFYGIASLVKLYLGTRNDYSLKCVIPHGIVFKDDHIWPAECMAHLPVIFSYPEYRKKIYTEKTNKIVLNGPSPYLILKKLGFKESLPPRNGLIFFPAHSTHHVTAIMDFAALAEKLSSLEEKFKPITICIYWKDYLLGNHIPFKEKGFQIVSAGHIYDQNFLIRLNNLLLSHKYAASNAIGSSLFYSVSSGCSFFLLDYGNFNYQADKKVLMVDTPKIPISREEEIRFLFSTPQDKVSQDQQKLVNYYLGEQYFQTKHYFKLQMLFCEATYRLFYKKINSKNRTEHKPTYFNKLFRKIFPRGEQHQ